MVSFGSWLRSRALWSGACLVALLPLAAVGAGASDKPAGAKPAARTLEAVHPEANPAKTVDGQAPFEEAPLFRVVTRKKDTDMHPCGDCHDETVSDFKPRDLQRPHDNFKLEHGLHGRGEFWCFTCHRVKGTGGLKTMESERLVFDEAYVICSQCHAQEARDWTHGAHGKRVGSWEGERTLLSCTVCHFQHRPKMDPRKAEEPPPVRRGLPRQDTAPHEPVPVWERHGAQGPVDQPVPEPAPGKQAAAPAPVTK